MRARRLKPLAPGTYLVRNASKTLPLTAVIVLAVMLVCGIIALINSIPDSIRNVYSYSKEVLGVTPRGDPTMTGHYVNLVKKGTPVPIERVMICRASPTEVKSIVGNWPFLMLGLSQGDMRWYLERQGSKGIQGRLPRAGKPEALVSRPVALNLKLKLGSIVQGPKLDDSYSPKPVKVVGIANTDRWLMLNSIEYQRAYHFPPIDFAMIAARNLHDQSILDRWAENRFKGEHVQMWAYHQIDKRTREMFATLYTILDVVILTLAIVITIMMGMLMNIYQSQRLVEFGLLQAIGYTKRQLVRRVTLESIAVVAWGWLFGLFAAFLLLVLAKLVLMDPNAYALNLFDPVAYAYTLPLPIAIMLVAIGTVWLRFRRFDPVAVVERRLV